MRGRPETPGPTRGGTTLTRGGGYPENAPKKEEVASNRCSELHPPHVTEALNVWQCARVADRETGSAPRREVPLRSPRSPPPQVELCVYSACAGSEEEESGCGSLPECSGQARLRTAYRPRWWPVGSLPCPQPPDMPPGRTRDSCNCLRVWSGGAEAGPQAADSPESTFGIWGQSPLCLSIRRCSTPGGALSSGELPWHRRVRLFVS